MLRIIFVIGALLVAGAAQAQTSQPPNIGTTNGSVTIATGNAFQTVLAVATVGARRNSLTIQNNNTNGDSCWLFIGSGAASKAISILLTQGGSYQRYAPYIPIDVIQATCTTTSDTLYVDTQ